MRTAGAPSNEINTKLSISYWIRTTTSKASIETLAQYSAASPGWEMWFRGVGHISFYVYLSGSAVYRDSASTINDGKWHQVVAVYDGTVPSENIYVDGTLSNGGISGTPPSTRTVSTAQITFGAYTTSLNGTCVGFFPGSLDDVRIYNRALSAQEVAQLYSAGR